MQDLEIRLMHLEAALDEMTRVLLDQEQNATRQAELIRQLEAHIKTLSSQGGATAEREPPPPHY